MAGRRWAEGKPTGGSRRGEDRPRPSERGTAKAREPRNARRERERAERMAAAAARPQPSPEAIARAKERLSPPKAAWHPLPLAELAVGLGFIVMAVGFAIGNVTGAGAGFALTTLGTIEFTWREHRHGYRSHGAVLGGLVGLIAGFLAWKLAGFSRDGCLAVAFVVFGLTWALLTKVYVAAEDRAIERSRGDAS